MIELISFTLFIFIFFVLVYKNIKLKIKLSAKTIEILRLSIDNTVLSDKLIETLDVQVGRSDDTSGAFLKFVSDSRDWAYQYIEDVQESLNKFISDIEPEILYFDTYGDLMGAEPNHNSMKKISGSYKELKKLLPEEYDKINK
jgi:hypothetical protein